MSKLKAKMLKPIIRSSSGVLQISSTKWRAIGPDPYFELALLGGTSRFARLSAIISADKYRINSKVYVGKAAHRSENRVIAHSKPNQSIHSFIVNLDKDGDLLRLDPHNSSATFSIFALHFYEYDTDEKAALAMHVEIRKRISSTAKINTEPLSCLSPSELYEEYIKIFSGLPIEDQAPYQTWQDYVEKSWFNEAGLRGIQRAGKPHVSAQTDKPFFSLVVPVYNPRERDLKECVQSIRSQTHQDWELILVDDASTCENIPILIKSLAATDSRIKVISRSHNGHISAATNDGIRASIGKYICLVDNDDILSIIALEEIYQKLQMQPNLKLVYSDEDFISDSGKRLFPHFKTDWNRELLFAHNYITHFCCIEANLLKDLGMRLGYEGSQDYDLMLRISELVQDSDVCHMPRILYHWRMSSTSTASSASAKSYTVQAGLKALQDHLARTKKQAKARPLDADNFYRIEWAIPAGRLDNAGPLVSIVIPTRNSKELVRSCVESISLNTEFDDYEVIVADNDSDDPEALAYFDQLSSGHHNEFRQKVKIVKCPGPFNYSAINNTAVNTSNAEFICLLNNDTTVINREWLGELLSHAARPDVGCVGAKLLYPDDTIQHAGIVLGLGGVAGHSHKGWQGESPGYFNRLRIVHQVAAVTGACLVMKRQLFNELGGLDEDKFAVAYNDVDLCLKAWSAGYKNIFSPFAQLYHHESKTRGYEDTPSKKRRFEIEKARLVEKWGHVLARDPFYSDNLTLDREDFSIRVPPGHH